MSATTSFADLQAAMSLLNHVYFNPIIAALVRHEVADHLEPDPLSAADLARRSGLNALALTRVLRALAAFGTFKEIAPGYSPTILSPSCFAISPVDSATSSSTTPLSTTSGRPQPWLIAS